MWRELMPPLPANHAVFHGHFPGRPIIPGAMLLDALLHAAGGAGATVAAAKFLHPVGPEQAVEFRQTSTGAEQFELRAVDRNVAIVSLRRPAPP